MIVFVIDGRPTVYAVPDDWDYDDIERFVQAYNEDWELAASTSALPIPASYLDHGEVQ